MTTLGYALSSEQHPPNDLVDRARRAEDAGLEFAVLSDHYHPWIDVQGHSPLAWTVLGGIATATDSLELGTGVTCPTIRYHPGLVAQAAGTVGAMMPDRFFLGVGTGERLNEHVFGDQWPPHHVRLEMLVEAVEVIRDLWTGETVSHHGDHYTLENARLYTLPDSLPPIHVAAGGPEMATAAGEIGDGLVSTAPEESIVEEFEQGGDGDRPRYGQFTACYAETEDEARRVVHEHWPNGALPGELGQELSTPTHFEQATSLVTEDDAAKHVALGSDPQQYVDSIRAYADAGFDHVYVHQANPDAEGFFEFYAEEVVPEF